MRLEQLEGIFAEIKKSVQDDPSVAPDLSRYPVNPFKLYTEVMKTEEKFRGMPPDTIITIAEMKVLLEQVTNHKPSSLQPSQGMSE